jgi:hypothetical protein
VEKYKSFSRKSERCWLFETVPSHIIDVYSNVNVISDIMTITRYKYVNKYKESSHNLKNGKNNIFIQQ